ncbi:MAG: hypothetical protein IPI46_05415 [Bacteroidetes bacterium]|nr:hypothetical protein [Bacteroidota bacterium]
MRKEKSKNSPSLRKLITLLRVNICDVINETDMKTQTFIKPDFNIQAFSIERIIFDDSDLVSIDIHCRLLDKFTKTTLLFTFSKFNDLLRFSGSNGEKLQLMVSDKLLSNDEKPYILQLKDAELIFSTCALDISFLLADDASCFNVEEVSPLSYLQQAKNLRTNMQDFNSIRLDDKIAINHILKEIATMYRYYKGLKELNLNENAAREKSGLQNDKLFKIAFHAASSNESVKK